MRRGLPGWYEEAMADAEITPVGDPSSTSRTCPPGAPLAFTIEVGVVPPAQLGDYLRPSRSAGARSADPDQVQAELERLRESLAALETVERPAAAATSVWTSTARSTVRSSKAARPAAT